MTEKKGTEKEERRSWEGRSSRLGGRKEGVRSRREDGKEGGGEGGRGKEREGVRISDITLRYRPDGSVAVSGVRRSVHQGVTCPAESIKSQRKSMRC